MVTTRRTRALIAITAPAAVLTVGILEPSADANRAPAKQIASPPPTTIAQPPPLADDYALADTAWLQQRYQIWLAEDLQIRLNREAAEAAATAARRAALDDLETAVWRRTGRTMEDWLGGMILDRAAEWSIDPVTLGKITICESGGNPGAYNPSGASGLTQQMKYYWPGRAVAAGIEGADVFDPWANLTVAAHMLQTSTSPWNASWSCWH